MRAVNFTSLASNLHVFALTLHARCARGASVCAGVCTSSIKTIPIYYVQYSSMTSRDRREKCESGEGWSGVRKKLCSGGKMAEKSCTVRTRKFITNRLLGRRQFVVDVLHPGRATVPKAELAEKLAKMYKVQDQHTIVLFGFHTKFGGGRSSGFGLVYDNMDVLKKIEPKYRQRRQDLMPKAEGSRKSRKIKKLRLKKLRGKEKSKVARSS